MKAGPKIPPVHNEWVEITLIDKAMNPRSDLQTAGLPRKNRELRSGDLCPTCSEQRLDYDGLLYLACPKCGPAAGGCFT